jgi:hypothetical protein
MNALIDNDRSDFQLKEADEGLELSGLVTYSRLGVNSPQWLGVCRCAGMRRPRHRCSRHQSHCYF